jgi:alanine dehydrogenase
MRVLTDDDVAAVLDLPSLLPVVADAFRAQGRGAVERPDRPHFPIGAGLRGEEPLGTGLTMPAYVHGARYVATKLVTVHEDNPARGLSTVQAQIALQDAETGTPAAYMDGRRITNARTGCIGGLAARELAAGPVTLGVVGSGTQARWQTRAIAAATDLREVRIYSRSDSREACAADLRAELDCPVAAVESAREAVTAATVVVTTTTATEPVFPADALAEGALVVGVGAYTPEMQELAPAVFAGARVFADVPEEALHTGDAVAADLDESAITPLSAVLEAGRESLDERLVVLSVGTAVLDAATAEHVLGEAEERGVGTDLSL